VKGETVEDRTRARSRFEARQEMECGSWECGVRFRVERRGEEKTRRRRRRRISRCGWGVNGWLKVVKRKIGKESDHEGMRGGRGKANGDENSQAGTIVGRGPGRD
jgi:hypothetical protein